MEFTALEIATYLKGEIIGDSEIKINNVSKIEKGESGTLSFLANPKYEHYIYETNSSVVLVNKDFKPQKEVKATLIKVQDAYQALASLMDLYVASIPEKRGLEIPSYIDSSSTTGENVYIGAFAYIGKNVKIGNNVKIYPHCWIDDNVTIDDNTKLYSGVKVYSDCRIGKSCIIHAGAVIGSDGFGFSHLDDGSYKKLHQIGNVVIKDDVEIGANTTIDCATMGSTVINKGVKLDNLIQVAHNAEIGKHTVIAAQTGIAGSSTVGDYCILAGQVGIAGHVKVGNKVTLAAKTGASKNIKDGSVLMGEWGFDAGQFRKAYSIFRNLPQLRQELIELKKEVRSK